MNYEKIYYDLIKDRSRLQITRKMDKINYYEKHHIIPKCMGGPDNKENIIILTAREHFIAHALLVKMYPTNRKILNAFICMKRNKSKNRYINSNLYEKLKKYWVESNSGENHHLYGKTHSEEAKQKISIAKKGKISVKDINGNNFSLDKTDPRVLSGEFKHVTKGRKMKEKEYENYINYRKSVPNFNSNKITDDEIVNHAIHFYEINGIWILNEWKNILKKIKSQYI